MALKIGFSRKYYTVWEYSVSYRTDERGINYKTEHYTFLRNASMNKEKALAKYPEATFDENLRGRTRSWDYEHRIVENNKFQYGKYAGILFTACTDYPYLMWFYNSCASDAQKEIIEPVLLAEGYEVDEFTTNWNDGFEEHTSTYRNMISPEDVKARKEQEERELQGKSRLAKGIPFVVTMDKNLNDMGEYFIHDLEITIRFENYKENYYQGYYYGLPLDKKGHAKRVKNKQLLIEKYELKNDTTALVKEWRFA